MEFPFLQFLLFLPAFCFPFVFLAIGIPVLLGLSWLAGSVNCHNVIVTIDYEEDRVVDKGTVNIMTGLVNKNSIMLHNNPSVFGWKWFRKTVEINKKIVPGKTYELKVAGFTWPYGQNIIEVVREV